MANYAIVAGKPVVTDFVIGEFLPDIKVKNVTTGKGNYAATYKAGFKKLRNHTANKMSKTVIVKGVWSSVVDGFYGSVVSGVDDHLSGVVNRFSD